MAREVIDLPGPAPDLAPALVGVDRGLRLGLGAAFAVAAVLAPGAPWRLALAAVAVLHLADRLARPAALAAAVLALPALVWGGAPAPWLGVLAAAAVRARLQWGPSGEHLARVRGLRRSHARGVAAMELHRARAAQRDEDARAAELQRAGDAFERAGRARTELRALGVETRPSPLLRYAASATAALPPRLARMALRWLEGDA
jgi:hypothetical protein